MTGSYPTDKKERELWKLEGKQPNSVKVGGKWLSFNYTSPAGQVLAIGGKMADARKNGGNVTDQAIAGLGAIPKTVTEQSFLQGVQGIQDAIADPEKQGKKFFKSQASSVVPTIVSDVAKATDPLQRQSNTVKEAIQAKIPGLNQGLLPKQDAFGAPVPRASSAVNTLVNPFRPMDVRPSNDLNGELRRLQDSNYGVMPDSTDKQFTFGSKDKGNLETINLTPKQLFDKNSKVGQLVQQKWGEIIKSPGIKNDDKLHASVSVAPRDLVESYLNVLRSAGLEVISFEIQPKSIAHAILPSDCHETQIIVYGMNNKYGIYVVSSGVVCFTSTIDTTGQLDNILQLELKKVYQYWNEHEPEKEIKKIKLTGKGSIQIFNDSKISPDPRVSVEVGNVWSNAFSNDNYIPPISFEDSQEYVVAAGLALQ
jgi:hypothetical protein